MAIFEENTWEFVQLGSDVPGETEVCLKAPKTWSEFICL